MGARGLSARNCRTMPAYSRSGAARMITKTPARESALSGSRRLPKGKNRAAAERIQGVDEDQIQVAPEPGVLKTVVQQEDVRPVFLFEQAAGHKTVGADARVGVARLHEDLRLVSGEADGRGFSRLHQNRGFDGAAAISARKNRGMMAASHAAARPGDPPWEFSRPRPC